MAKISMNELEDVFTLKKWQLILCCVGICFVPALALAIGYSVTKHQFGLVPSIIPYLPLIIGVGGSYCLYNDCKKYFTF